MSTLAAALYDTLRRRQPAAAGVDPALLQPLIAALIEALEQGELGLDLRQAVLPEGCLEALAATPGYREFKVEDGYDNGVRVVVALRLGQREQGGEGPGAGLHGLPTREPQLRREFALVRLGPSPFALPAGDVAEALPARDLVITPNRSSLQVGMMEVPTRDGPRVVQVLSGRAMVGLEQPARTSEAVVVVVRPHGAALPTCGLLVDELLAVVEVGPEHRQPVPAGLRAGAPMLSGLLRVGTASGKDVIVQELDAAALAPRPGVPVALG